MRIAFTTKGTTWDSAMDPRFGRTEYLLIYDEETDELIHFDNRAIEGEAHGAGPKTAQKLFELKADVLITGNGPGGNAAAVIEKAGIDVFIDATLSSVREAYQSYKMKSYKIS
jgi:predicted Fe-Mo cluster-binding NifX family protein